MSLQSAIAAIANNPQIAEMRSKSWWPSYMAAVNTGDPNQVIAWAQSVAPQFHDFNGATDGNFVGSQVVSMQARQEDPTLFGIPMSPNLHETLGQVGGALGTAGLAAGALVGGGALLGLGGTGAAGAGAAGGLTEAGMADLVGLGSAADIAAVDSALGLGGAVAGGAVGGAAVNGLLPSEIGMEGSYGVNPSEIGMEGSAAGASPATTGTAATGTGTGAKAATTGAAAAGGGSALSRILNGTATTEDWLSVGGAAAPALLGAYASNKQTGALENLANKYAEYGAPSRGRYEASMTPGFDPTSIPGYSGAVDTASKSILAKLSASGGNPFGNPGGLIDAQKQIISGTALPAVNEYQRLNAATGFGQTLQSAGGFGQNAIGSEGNFYNALGAGLNDVTNPPKDLAQQLAEYEKARRTISGGAYSLS